MERGVCNMMKKPVFTGAAVAIITPMNADGSVNFEEFGRVIEDQIAGHTDAIVVCGTTGESATMPDDEHLSVIDYCVKKVNHRIPVIAGTGSNDTAHGIRLTQNAEKLGVDAVLLVTPYYNKTSQQGLITHFKALANATSLPCILYNVPSRTGVNIQPETAYELSKIPNINAIKEASGNISQVAKIAHLCGENLNIYSGNDDQIVPLLALGGKGVISVLSNVAPRETHEICQNWFDGNPAASLAMQMKYLPLCEALFCDVNPIPVKYAMNLLGYQAGSCRLPLVDPSEANKERIHHALTAAGLL